MTTSVGLAKGDAAALIRRGIGACFVAAPWHCLDDPNLRKTRMPRLGTVLAILFGLAGTDALWLFGAWLSRAFA